MKCGAERASRNEFGDFISNYDSAFEVTTSHTGVLAGADRVQITGGHDAKNAIAALNPQNRGQYSRIGDALYGMLMDWFRREGQDRHLHPRMGGMQRQATYGNRHECILKPCSSPSIDLRTPAWPSYHPLRE